MSSVGGGSNATFTWLRRRRRHLLRRSAAVRGRALVHTYYYILCTSGFVVYVVGTSSWSGAAEFRINIKFRITVEHLFYIV